MRLGGTKYLSMPFLGGIGFGGGIGGSCWYIGNRLDCSSERSEEGFSSEAMEMVDATDADAE